MPNIDLSILNQRQTPAFYADVFANRPAAGFVGRIFVSTDTFAFYRDNGTSWDLIGGPGTGTITGSGTAGTIPLWSGASTIGNSDLRQLSSEALILNSATNDWPSSIGEDPGRFLITNATNNPALILWGKAAFGSGDEQGSIALGNVTALGSTSFGGAYLDGSIENGTDGSGQLTIRTSDITGTANLALKIDSTQKSTFYNDIILSSGAATKRLILDANVNVARIFSIRTNNLPRWAVRVDDTESGSETGSNFALRRYNDAGTFVDAPLTVTRSTGQSTFAKKVVIENNAGDQQLQIVSTTAPSLRFDNLQTGATKRAGLGLATAVNNFIQGSADRDFCIFNGSTTVSPILFGIYDAGLTNTQEAARISINRNFIVGRTADSGERLQISGTALITGAATFNSSINTTGLIINNNGEAIRAYGISPNISFYNAANTVRGGYINHDGSNMNIVSNVGSILFGSDGIFASSLRTNSHMIVSDGVSSVVLQGYINNALRIAVAGSASSGGARGDLYAGAADLNTITTGTPSGGTAGIWKLGTYTAGAAVQGGKVRVEINGVPYDLLTT